MVSSTPSRFPLVRVWSVSNRSIAALASAKTRLTKAGFGEIDYFDLRHSDSLQPVETLAPNCRIFAAIQLGKTRLIDNYAL